MDPPPIDTPPRRPVGSVVGAAPGVGRARRLPAVCHAGKATEWRADVHVRGGWSPGPSRRAGGAPAVEGYPVDNAGEKVDLTMAYVGTRHVFERAGFTKASDTTSVLNGFPRVLMRLDLR